MEVVDVDGRGAAEFWVLINLQIKKLEKKESNNQVENA